MKNSSIITNLLGFNPTKEESLSMWSDFGFLEGLPENIKQEAAEKMTEMTMYLINTKESYPDYVDVLVYPIIRRCIQNGGLAKYYKPQNLCRFITTTYETLRQGFWSLGVSENFDSDGEICALISYLFTKKDDKENN